MPRIPIPLAAKRAAKASHRLGPQGINQKKGKYRVNTTYSNGGDGAATPLTLPTQTIVGAGSFVLPGNTTLLIANRQPRLPLLELLTPIAAAELENMLRAAGIERTLETAVAVERD